MRFDRRSILFGASALAVEHLRPSLYHDTNQKDRGFLPIVSAEAWHGSPTEIFTWAAFGLSAPNGVPTSSFDISSMRPSVGKEYMVSYTGGNDLNVGTSWLKPLKTISAAVAKTDWDTITIDETAGVTGTNRWYGKEGSARARPVTRAGLIRTRFGGRVTIINSRETLNVPGAEAPKWRLHIGSIYKTDFYAVGSDAQNILDLAINDDDGFPSVYTRVSSIDSIEAGTYFFDKMTGIYFVRSKDSRNLVGTRDIIVSDSSNTFTWRPELDRARLYIENIDFIGGARAFRALGTQPGYRYELCMSGVRLIGGGKSNTLAVAGGFDCYMVDTQTVAGAQDGFNYHYSSLSGEHPRIFELRCKSGYTGYNGQGANNGSTTHFEGSGIAEGGGRIVRALGTYRGSADRTIHDLGPDSWIFGCIVDPPRGPIVGTRSTLRSGPKNRMWIDRCYLSHSANTTADLYNADGGQMLVSNSTDISHLSVRGHVGRFLGL